jgi:hypothetical protein
MKKLITEKTFEDPSELPDYWAMYVVTMAQVLTEHNARFDDNEKWFELTEDQRHTEILITMQAIARMTVRIYNLEHS